MSVLCMILKEDDPEMVANCLRSVRPWVDHWCISDNGSTKEVKDAVRDCIGNFLPGQLYDFGFVNFAYNRNDVQARAKKYGDRCFWIDADATYVGSEPLPDHAIELVYKVGATSIHKPNNVSCGNWWWHYKIHEALVPANESDLAQPWDGGYILDNTGGMRSRDPFRFEKDLGIINTTIVAGGLSPHELLHYAMVKANTLRDLGRFKEAIQAFMDVVDIVGENDDDEDKWFSLFNVGYIAIDQFPEDDKRIAHALLSAYKLRPYRLEPLAKLAVHASRRGNHELAYACAREGTTKMGSVPKGRYAVFPHLYLWGMRELCSDVLAAQGKHAEAKAELDAIDLAMCSPHDAERIRHKKETLSRNHDGLYLTEEGSHHGQGNRNAQGSKQGSQEG